jgi:hypothetical protein
MFPVTPAAEAARSVATRFYSPALLNHTIRSYLWGAMYGELLALLRPCFARVEPWLQASTSVPWSVTCPSGTDG